MPIIMQQAPSCSNNYHRTLHETQEQSGAGLAHVPDQPAAAVAHAQVINEERNPPVRARHGAAAALHGDFLHLPPLRRQRRSAQHRLQKGRALVQIKRRPTCMPCRLGLKDMQALGQTE